MPRQSRREPTPSIIIRLHVQPRIAYYYCASTKWELWCDADDAGGAASVGAFLMRFLGMCSVQSGQSSAVGRAGLNADFWYVLSLVCNSLWWANKYTFFRHTNKHVLLLSKIMSQIIIHFGYVWQLRFDIGTVVGFQLFMHLHLLSLFIKPAAFFNKKKMSYNKTSCVTANELSRFQSRYSN